MVRLTSRFWRELPVVLRQIVISFLYALPHVLGLLPAAAGASLKLLWDASKSTIEPLREEADRISGESVRRAILTGFPYLWQRQLKKIFYVVSLLAVVGVWVLILLGLALIIRILF